MYRRYVSPKPAVRLGDTYLRYMSPAAYSSASAKAPIAAWMYSSRPLARSS